MPTKYDPKKPDTEVQYLRIVCAKIAGNMTLEEAAGKFKVEVSTVQRALAWGKKQGFLNIASSEDKKILEELSEDGLKRRQLFRAEFELKVGKERREIEHTIQNLDEKILMFKGLLNSKVIHDVEEDSNLDKLLKSLITMEDKEFDSLVEKLEKDKTGGKK